MLGILLLWNNSFVYHNIRGAEKVVYYVFVENIQLLLLRRDIEPVYFQRGFFSYS